MLRILSYNRRRIDPFALFLLYTSIDLLAVDWDLLWGIYTNAYLVALCSEDGNIYRISDFKRFPHASSQYKHYFSPRVTVGHGAIPTSESLLE